MPENKPASLLLLEVSAYAVIVAFGIRYASGILSLVLISLLLAYAILPFPTWLRRRHGVSKGSAMVLTAIFVIVLQVILSIALIEASFQMHAKLPIYGVRRTEE